MSPSMINKRNLVSAGVVVLLGLLIYLQVHNWKKFDWATFWNNTSHVNWEFVALSIAITLSTYWLRAVRWRIFLKPMCRTTTARLLGPQFIGFTGLALLGRPGEMIRPYMIARKENQTFSSQVAVWLVERIFDMAAVAVMFVIAGFVGDPLWSTLPNHNLASAVRWSAGLFLRRHRGAGRGGRGASKVRLCHRRLPGKTLRGPQSQVCPRPRLQDHLVHRWPSGHQRHSVVPAVVRSVASDVGIDCRWRTGSSPTLTAVSSPSWERPASCCSWSRRCSVR